MVEVNVSASRSIATMSACRVTDQKPWLGASSSAPVHRRLAAQDVELAPGLAVLERVEVGQVDLGQGHGAGLSVRHGAHAALQGS